jgi:hypothetical protein
MKMMTFTRSLQLWTWVSSLSTVQTKMAATATTALQSTPTTTSLLRTKTPALTMTLPLEMTLMVKVQWCLKQWLAETVTLKDPTGSGMH